MKRVSPTWTFECSNYGCAERLRGVCLQRFGSSSATARMGNGIQSSSTRCRRCLSIYAWKMLLYLDQFNFLRQWQQRNQSFIQPPVPETINFLANGRWFRINLQHLTRDVTMCVGNLRVALWSPRSPEEWQEFKDLWWGTRQIWMFHGISLFHHDKSLNVKTCWKISWCLCFGYKWKIDGTRWK